MARIGIIGLGFMGRRWARTVAEHPGADLSIVCDIDEARAQRIAQEFEVPWSCEPEATAADHQLHGVAVCTPEAMHEDIAVAAIGAGHAVMVEKPIAHDLAAAERIRAAAQAAGVPVLVGHIRSSGVLQKAGYDVEDLYSLTLRFTSGAHGASMLGWSQPSTTATPGLSGFTVLGEVGYLRVDQGSTGLAGFGDSGAVALGTWYAPQVHGLLRGALAIEADHFVRVVRGEADPLCTATDGTEALRANLAVERAAAHDRIVDMAEMT